MSIRVVGLYGMFSRCMNSKNPISGSGLQKSTLTIPTRQN